MLERIRDRFATPHYSYRVFPAAEAHGMFGQVVDLPSMCAVVNDDGRKSASGSRNHFVGVSCPAGKLFDTLPGAKPELLSSNGTT